LGRMFVFAYVFTLPFALLSDDLHLKSIQVVFLVVITTYGFIGCELLFVELNDPFAEDPNDLPLVEEERAAVDDVILSLYDADGQHSAVRLKNAFPHASLVDFYGEQVSKHGPKFKLKKKTSLPSDPPKATTVDEPNESKNERDPLL